MVAPTPVSALLHAVAVVKAGAFGIVRVVYDVYGHATVSALGLALPLAVIAAATILYGSLQALRQGNLKLRLAYSTVSQLSYIVLGTALAGTAAAMGGLVHLVHQGIMKITLFFCAGILAETLGVHDIHEMRGAGRRLPATMLAFTVAALGMMAAPPMAGFISEWYLGTGALAAGEPWALGVLVLSSLLNAAYFLPIVYDAWFRAPPEAWPEERRLHPRLETRASLLIPALATALLTLAFGLFAGTGLAPLDWVRVIAEREFAR
jgi:multicomponent Na+:H+ antiporter subunit D